MYPCCRLQQARVLQEPAEPHHRKRWNHCQSTLSRGRWTWCHGALLGPAAAAPPMRAIAPGSSTTLARWLSRRREGEPERFTMTVAALFLKPVAFPTPSHQAYASISMSTSASSTWLAGGSCFVLVCCLRSAWPSIMRPIYAIPEVPRRRSGGLSGRSARGGDGGLD